ncbi:MAG: type I-E CRISPR-associated protein Cse1/CasA [Nitrospiraceae bacterium]|nr:MAG: type I-E CRISPR-associated protein Cse1/CasA [Nitrospiraceae bacterium]
MNLLKDDWIPVRPLQFGSSEKISLQRLLCGEEKWEVCLPRDDMELAEIQLLICLAQTLFMPQTVSELKQRIAKPLDEKDFEEGIKPPYSDWFQLDHPDWPFMQKKGAKSLTQMDKLMTGVDSATNCCFVNEPGLATQLCGGCTAIALFNLASCSPSFGGGFKPGLRGPATPITTLVQGRHLRETVWLNVLYELEVERIMPWYREAKYQKPTWVEPIMADDNMAAQQIGLMRGLLWQPAFVELIPPSGKGTCSCCGYLSNQVYIDFNKDKFKYTVEGKWPHPHSPLILIQKKGELKEEHASFKTSTAPSWTQLSRFVVQQQIDTDNKEGQQPAAVVLQVQLLYGQEAQKLHLLVGGYLNRAGQASVLGRRHDVFTLNHGWDKHTKVVREIVNTGLGYKDALSKSLWVFVNGLKESKGNDGSKIKGLGEKLKLHEVATRHFFRRSEPVVQDTLARIDFAAPAPTLTKMRSYLKHTVMELFDESVRPYLQDPELIKTMAIARRTLYKQLSNLEPPQNKGGNNGATTT